MQKEPFRFNSDAFSLIEVILAGSVFVIVITAIVSAFFYGQISKQVAGQRTRATFLADEALEALRNIRDDNFNNIADGTYGLTNAAGYWALQATSDVTGIYTRTVHISSIDANTKYIDATVTWQQTPQRAGSVILITYLTNWPRNENWVVPRLGSTCLDLQGGQNARKVDLNGNYAYFVTDSASQSFVTVNVGNPDVPVFSGGTSLQNNPRNLQFSNGTAYISSENNSQELQVISVSNPSSPTVVGYYNASGNSTGTAVAVSGSTAYLVRDSGTELFSINVTNPAAPTLRTSLALGGGARDIVILGAYAYVASQSDTQELQVVSIANPDSPVLVGSYNLSGTSDATSIAAWGNTVAVGRVNGDVSLLDVTTPTSPQPLGTYNTGATVNDMAIGVSNTRLFVVGANTSAEVQILDVSSPASVTLRGSYNAQSTMNGVVYSPTQDVAFVVGSSNSQGFCALKPQ